LTIHRIFTYIYNILISCARAQRARARALPSPGSVCARPACLPHVPKRDNLFVGLSVSLSPGRTVLPVFLAPRSSAQVAAQPPGGAFRRTKPRPPADNKGPAEPRSSASTPRSHPQLKPRGEQFESKRGRVALVESKKPHFRRPRLAGRPAQKRARERPPRCSRNTGGTPATRVRPGVAQRFPWFSGKIMPHTPDDLFGTSHTGASAGPPGRSALGPQIQGPNRGSDFRRTGAGPASPGTFRPYERCQ
jgi:hypothetical protein